jgi:hypothetical protein|tara:strand:+ start:101 stop:322 length:222 start_codon:yes stop_codon:yes gene_type:complete
MIAELKQKKELDKLYRQNTIDLNNYFAYSGKQEVKKKFVDFVNEYKFKKRIIINNDMSKYVLKKDKQSLTKIK